MGDVGVVLYWWYCDWAAAVKGKSSLLDEMMNQTEHVPFLVGGAGGAGIRPTVVKQCRDWSCALPLAAVIGPLQFNVQHQRRFAHTYLRYIHSIRIIV